MNEKRLHYAVSLQREKSQAKLSVGRANNERKHGRTCGNNRKIEKRRYGVIGRIGKSGVFLKERDSLPFYYSRLYPSYWSA